jgi:hypothetical protein
VTFRTHEHIKNSESCQLHVNVDAGKAKLLKQKAQIDYNETPKDEDILATYQLLHPKDKQIMLLQLLSAESRLIPLQYRAEPQYLFKIPHDNQYILITKSGEKPVWKVLIGNAGQWNEIPVTSVSRFRNGGTTYVELNQENGIKTIYCPSLLHYEFDPLLIMSDESKIVLEKFDHREFDYASIGITLEPFSTRPTPLDEFRHIKTASQSLFV